MRAIIKKCNERRIYYSKHGQIPFKATVKLYAKVRFNSGYMIGAFEWNGKKFIAPIRILRKVKEGLIND